MTFEPSLDPTVLDGSQAASRWYVARAVSTRATVPQWRAQLATWGRRRRPEMMEENSISKETKRPRTAGVSSLTCWSR